MASPASSCRATSPPGASSRTSCGWRSSDLTNAQPPVADLYCPVCGTVVERIWVWQETGGDRARVFCNTCADLPEYTALPRLERWEGDVQSFYFWASQRM